MNLKLDVLLILCIAILVPSVAIAQEFELFAKQRVVVADIIDRNDRKLSDAIKRVIHQGIIDACVSSNLYEVHEVNIGDIKNRIVSRGEQDTFQNVCKEIGKRADYIIFTNVKVSTSDLQSLDIKLFLNASLYRISTASEVLTQVVIAEPTSQSIMTATAQLASKLLKIENKTTAELKEPDDDEPFIKVEQMPSFMGGNLDTFRNWVMGQIRFPTYALENNIKGVVVAKFYIEKDGRLSNVSILKSPDKSLSEEVLRVLNGSPKWEAGMQRNRRVRVQYTIPIHFKYTNN